MNLEEIKTDKAPAAIGPYSQAIKASGFVFCSGQIPLDPSTGEVIEGDITAQAEQVMKNIAAMLEAVGAKFDQIVKTTIFLVDMVDFGAVNSVYGRFFPINKPARSTVAVASLPRGVRLEIEVIIATGE